MSLSFLLRRRLLSTAASSDPRANLSARLSFVFDQIDAIDRDRSRDLADKDEALQRIRSWRHSQTPKEEPPPVDPTTTTSGGDSLSEYLKKEIEVVHPWPEWIELLERLGHQNYFDRRGAVEKNVADSVGIDLSDVKEEVGFDFSRDWLTVRNACINFGRDRFDILKSLPRKDIQVLVGHGCPSLDPKTVFSAKLLRKYVHLDEGDVCSACSLRSSCRLGYIPTRKEDEARTLDVMRILLTFGFDHVNGAVENKSLMKNKSVKTVVRKLLHEVVKLSAVPIDPNLPPPVVKKPPPKVKQPPPTPKRRVGRDDVEMKKGDWLCAKCDFMNFAKNTVCLQCDAKRPKRQLLPGEWECPQCNFLNYRRNMACFHCDAKRPPDEFMENQFMEKQSGPRTRMERNKKVQDVSNAWNFDFDDNESDGADVAAFEFADSARAGVDSAPDDFNQRRSARGFEDDIGEDRKMPRSNGRGRYLSDGDEIQSSPHSGRTGFDDFDDEEDDIESYELEGSNNNQANDVSRKSLSEIEDTSDSEDYDDFNRHNVNKGARDDLSESEDDELADEPNLKSSHIADSWQKSKKKSRKSHDSSEDLDYDSDFDGEMDVKQNSRKKGIRMRGGGSDSDGGLFLGSDSDGPDDDLYSEENFSRGNKGSSDRRTNNFGKSERGEFRTADRTNNRRSSFGNPRDDFSSRSSRGDDYGGKRRNDWSQDFDRPNNGNRKNVRGNSFGGRGGNRDEMGSRGSNGFSREKSNNFGRRDERGPRRDERRGGGDRFSRGPSNNFGGRSKSFNNGDNGNKFGGRSSRFDNNDNGSNFRGRSKRFDDGDNDNKFGSRNRKFNNDNFRGRNRSFDNENNGDDRPRRRVIER